MVKNSQPKTTNLTNLGLNIKVSFFLSHFTFTAFPKFKHPIESNTNLAARVQGNRSLDALSIDVGASFAVFILNVNVSFTNDDGCMTARYTGIFQDELAIPVSADQKWRLGYGEHLPWRCAVDAYQKWRG
jgi:hypothetical protein